jgi:hypothetical protein
MKAQKLWEVVTFDLELDFEHGYSHWKALDEKNPSMGFIDRK